MAGCMDRIMCAGYAAILEVDEEKIVPDAFSAA
jgi:hypothetical protein